MNPLTGKALFLSIPVAGIAGAGTYFGLVKPYFLDETIKSKLERENKGKTRAILSSASDKIGDKFKVLYKNSYTSEKISGVNEQQLPNGCETNLKKTYSKKEDDVFKKASSGCVANTNTLKKELESAGFTFIADNAGAESGQRAWTNYNKNKESLEIESLKTPPANDATVEGPKLQVGCKSKLDKYMYESLADEEKTVEKVKKHCVIARASS